MFKFSRLLPALALLAGLFSAAQANAQGCGPQNPNCIVPTAPSGTSTNQAASTAFVQGAIAPFSPPGGSNGQQQYNNNGVFGGFTQSGDVTVDTSTGVAVIQPNAVTTGKISDANVTTGKIADGNVTNAKLAPGAANTVKGSLNGTTTSDLAIASCSAIYNFTQWLTGAGWQCGINAVLPSRAVAATLDLSAHSAVTTLGYASAIDGGGALYSKVGAQPFCGAYTNTTAFQDAAGNWWNIAEPIAYNFKQFGARFDWTGVDGTATDDSAAIQSALNCAGVQNSAGNDLGGGQGRMVYAPPATAMISSTVTVPNQVIVMGAGQYSSVLKMKDTFSASSHFILLGTQYSQTDIAALQSRGSAGDLTLNGSIVRSGVGYFLQPTVPAIFAASDNSGVNFTITGTDRYGAAQNQTIAGPTAGSFVEPTLYFSTITQVSTNAATVGDVSVGGRQIACFGSRLEEIQLFAEITNATSGQAMVFTNCVQHTGGLKGVKIFAGNRNASRFVTGFGGASYFVFEDVEGFNKGNCGACASNNAIFYFDYDGLLTPVRNALAQGPGASGGSTSRGFYFNSGFVNMSNWHCEGLATCVFLDHDTANNGYTILQNGIGATGMTTVVSIDSGVDANTVNVQGIYPNGSTNAINNRGALITGNVFPWTLY